MCAAVAQSVGIVRMRTQAMEFSLVFSLYYNYIRTVIFYFSFIAV
jgi:hypothetical protein